MFYFRVLNVTNIDQLPSNKVLVQFRNEYDQIYFASGKTIWHAISRAITRENGK